MDTAESRAYWDDEAATFDNAPDHGLLAPETRVAWWSLLSGLLPTPPATVADLGCGTGSVAVLLAEHGFAVTGVDLSPRMVEAARRKADAIDADLEFVLGDASDPVLPREAFDVVFARHVVWALPEPAIALERWRALIAPGGRLVLVEGYWSTNAGLKATDLRRLVEPLVTAVEVVPLVDPALWGRQVTDERYAIVARF